MVLKVEKLPIEDIQLGEAPHWDVKNQCLYFVDIPGGSIHKYVPATKKHTKAIIGNDVSVIIPVEGQKDKFVIGCGKEVLLITWDGESDKVSNTKKISALDNDAKNAFNKFNDGKCDPSGRLWIGTIGFDESKNLLTKNANLFSLGGNTKLNKHLSDITVSNGLAWNEKLKKFYYIDTPKKVIEEFDFDDNKGTISNGKIIFTVEKHNLPGMPDGMAIDIDGNLWVALFNGQKVIKIDPKKPETLLQTIEVPAMQPTSFAFGGQNLDELYLTTGRITFAGVEASGPDDGCVYKITGTGTKGLPPINFKYNLS